MDTVILRTGVEAPKVLVTAMHLVCRTMLNENPLAMFDAVSMARDSSYQPFGDNGQVLRDAAMLDCTGKMHSSVREVLCALFEGELMGMRLLGSNKFLKDEAGTQ